VKMLKTKVPRVCIDPIALVIVLGLLAALILPRLFSLPG